MALLDHENLDVYHRSIEFLTFALRLVGRLPRGEREIRDQLKRAAMSVPLNIAEAEHVNDFETAGTRYL
jgi:four helix bundle protein